MTIKNSARDKGIPDCQDGRLRRGIIALGLTCACAPVAALQPANIPLGPLKIEPTLLFDAAWVDNLYRSADDEIESWVFYTQPTLDVWLDNGPSKYIFHYELQDRRYSGTPSGEDDDFTGHLFRGDIHQRFNVRNELNLYAEHHRAAEERGTGLTEGDDVGRLTSEPLEYDRDSLGGTYIYGSQTGQGRLEATAEYWEMDYRNFESYTQNFDYDATHYQGEFFWGVAPKTALVLDASYLQTKYAEDRADMPSLDAQELRVLVGVEWEASGRTRGAVKVGGYERDFDDSERDKSTGFSWEVDVTYRLRTHSNFDFGAAQISRETNGQGDFIDSKEYTFDWLYMFKRGYRSNLAILRAEDDYKGTDREDVRLNVELSLTKAFRRWLEAGIGWRYEDRDSDEAQFKYERNEFFIDLKLSL
ncbi:outer membrane beta-barrel protein [Halioglobus sp. HI00S01]|uniref:outer membrane beta-barrel protein n=1 Tax=Halioglobus sp. HI00S01 TaxID=1822214 RepID=UPI0009EF12FE|nr:outer membrane beta-barrel protein [Halioglobus sp. HI00S01]